tara:strand:+ start:635 stop:847 length:213 start_codon:yes stop_codon:yes gene_type:complete
MPKYILSKKDLSSALVLIEEVILWYNEEMNDDEADGEPEFCEVSNEFLLSVPQMTVPEFKARLREHMPSP